MLDGWVCRLGVREIVPSAHGRARANRERIAQQVESAGSTDALAATQPDAMYSESSRADAALVRWLQSTIRAQRPAGVAAAQRAMATRQEQFETLSGLHVPVLCIRGAEDVVATADDHARMAESAHDALNVEVSGAGHLVPIERPTEFVAHVGAFLRSVRSPSC